MLWVIYMYMSGRRHFEQYFNIIISWRPVLLMKTRVRGENQSYWRTLSQVKLYRVHQLRTWIELAHLVAMGTDCMVTSLRCDILTNRVRWIIPATRDKKVNLVMKIRKERNKLEKTFAAWKPHQWCNGYRVL